VQQIKFELASCTGTLDTGTLSTAAPTGCSNSSRCVRSCSLRCSRTQALPTAQAGLSLPLSTSALLSSDVTRVLKKKYFFESCTVPQTLTSVGRERNAAAVTRGAVEKAENEVTAARFVTDRDENGLSHDVSAFEALLDRAVSAWQTGCKEAENNGFVWCG